MDLRVLYEHLRQAIVGIKLIMLREKGRQEKIRRMLSRRNTSIQD